jgi:hypothetical protein
MATGHVDTIALNLRASAGGAIIAVLRQNCSVEILGQSAGWLNVRAVQDGTSLQGWASANFIKQDAVEVAPAPPAAVPIADDDAHPVRVEGNNVIGPGNGSFGVAQHPAGFFVQGTTTLAAWLRTTAVATGISPSSANVLQAVINNEGHMEAVNSYDNAFLSFGLMQWTSGSDSDPGELAGLLGGIQTSDPSSWHDCFGQYGLGTTVGPAAQGRLQVGFLSLNNAPLRTPGDKQVLRSAQWAYRFWRAGHVDSIRRAQADLAAERIRLVCGMTIPGRGTVGAWLTSEHGVALVLDEHINRPSHVPATLAKALDDMIAAGASNDPTTWTGAQEAELIRRYIAERNTTSMTGSAKRADQIAGCVLSGLIADTRGSYKP